MNFYEKITINNSIYEQYIKNYILTSSIIIIMQLILLIGSIIWKLFCNQKEQIIISLIACILIWILLAMEVIQTKVHRKIWEETYEKIDKIFDEK